MIGTIGKKILFLLLWLTVWTWLIWLINDPIIRPIGTWLNSWPWINTVLTWIGSEPIIQPTIRKVAQYFGLTAMRADHWAILAGFGAGVKGYLTLLALKNSAGKQSGSFCHVSFSKKSLRHHGEIFHLPRLTKNFIYTKMTIYKLIFSINTSEKERC